MKALDTNVLVRFFVDDVDDVQATKQRPAAVAALSARAFVSVTVLLELERVLRGFYGSPRKEIARVMWALAGIQHITLEDRNAVLAAPDAFDGGFDFADALHLTRSARASEFMTFDRQLAKRATRLNLRPAVELVVQRHRMVSAPSSLVTPPQGEKPPTVLLP
jgi:predicted nucleic-acid-binding protein